MAGDSYRTHPHAAAVVNPTDMTPVLDLYRSGHDARDPHLSPLYGEIDDYFPPTVLISGTRDFLLSDTVRFHRALRAAGVRADLHVFEGAPHGLFAGHAPEDRECVAEIRRFLDDVWSAGPRS